MMNMPNSLQTSLVVDKNALGVTSITAHHVGDRLRSAREQKQLTASQIAFRIKVRKLYVEAIEGGDWDVLPPGLNGRGFVRQYAKELGLSIPEFEEFQNTFEKISLALAPDLDSGHTHPAMPDVAAITYPAPPLVPEAIIHEEVKEKNLKSANRAPGLFALTPKNMLLLFVLCAIFGFLFLFYISKHPF